MTRNVTHALRIIQDEVCYRVGKAILVKSTGQVTHSDADALVGVGLVGIADITGRVTITERGQQVLLDRKLSYRARRTAERFVEKHDSFRVRGNFLVAPDGARLSRYVMQYLIDTHQLVQNSDGGYVPGSRMVEVFFGELSMVNALLRHLRRRDA